MERPRLKATLVVPPVIEGRDLGLLLGPNAFDIRLCKGEMSQFASLLSSLTGAYTSSEISERTGLSEGSVRRVVEQLRSSGLIYDYNSPAYNHDIPHAVFLGAFEAFVAALRFDMFRHPLFSALHESEGLFLATAIEYFHLIRDASSHIEIALRHAPERLRELVTEYLDVEREHYLSLESVLFKALGGNFALDRLAPLSATESVILKTRELARTDTLAYLACCSFSEVQMWSRPPRVPDHWTAPIQAVFDAFLSHAHEDLDAGHSSLFADAVELSGNALHTVAAESILAGLHEYKHYFDNMNSEILRVYSQPGAPLPRLRPRWEDFVAARSDIKADEY